MSAQAVEKHEAAPQRVAIAQPASNPLMDMISEAVRAGQSIDVIRELKNMAKELADDAARRAFEAAMSEAKAEIPTITKNRMVDFSSSKGRTHYAHEDLGGIAKVVDPILGKHGLSYRFETTTENKTVKVVCIVSHREGHSVRNELTAAHDESGNKNSIQAVGSTLTYLQRMTLKAALGLAASDDDDGGASETGAFVSPSQLAQLVELADDVNADKVKFCKYLKVGSLAEIPAKTFDHARQLLEAKRGGK